MPRHSPFCIKLSASEKQELSRRAAKYTLPYFEVLRAKMILHAAEGLANDEIARHAVTSGLVASISATTVWRWLHQDAIRPWQHRCWIFPRDPDFAAKAGRLLDLYEGIWQDQPLREDEFVLSADEKTSIQARARIHASEPPRPHYAMKVEHEYERRGAWAYLAAWDVHHAKVFGRCEA